MCHFGAEISLSTRNDVCASSRPNISFERKRCFGGRRSSKYLFFPKEIFSSSGQASEPHQRPPQRDRRWRNDPAMGFLRLLGNFTSLIGDLAIDVELAGADIVDNADLIHVWLEGLQGETLAVAVGDRDLSVGQRW
jgi:hypothetical protein